MTPLRLTDEQLEQVMRTAAPIPPMSLPTPLNERLSMTEPYGALAGCTWGWAATRPMTRVRVGVLQSFVSDVQAAALSIGKQIEG